MIGTWHTEVRREYAGLDARFELPIRPLGRFRLVGLALVGLGTFWIWSPLGDLWYTAQALLDGEPASSKALPGLFQIPFLLAGCAPLVLGLLILFGRCRVEWRDGRLRSTEVLGPFWWTRRLPRRPLRRLGVVAAASADRTRGTGGLAGLSVLFAEIESAPRRIVALGYPEAWLLALAQELEALAGARGLSVSPVKVELVEEWSRGDEGSEDVTVQPHGSRIRLEEWSSGLRLTVPPAGLWRGSRGMFLIALVWCVLLAVFTAGVWTGDFEVDPPWLPFLIVAVFWAFGLGMLAVAVNMGRRTATLEVESGNLRLETRGLFGVTRRVWHDGELSAVRADASGLEVNDRPVLELQVHPLDGAKWGGLAGRDEEELRWVATLLRRALGLPAQPPHAA